MTDIPRHVSHAPPPPPPPARPTTGRGYAPDAAFYWPDGMSQWSPGESWGTEDLAFLAGIRTPKPEPVRRSLARRIGLRHPTPKEAA